MRYLKGYPSLAAFIASDSYHATAIFRRFHRLSARNLLQLQSELMKLEAQQDALDGEDLQASTYHKDGARDWQVLKSRAGETNNLREKERLRVALEIRSKLREYSWLPPKPTCPVLTYRSLRGSYHLRKRRSCPAEAFAAHSRCLPEFLQ